MEKTTDKTIITVVGKDTVGIIAKVCTYLAENGVNILDISQTIVSGYFNMMMITDMSGAKKSFADVSNEMDKLGEEIGVTIKCQREEIFEKMHRSLKVLRYVLVNVILFLIIKYWSHQAHHVNFIYLLNQMTVLQIVPIIIQRILFH